MTSCSQKKEKQQEVTQQTTTPEPTQEPVQAPVQEIKPQTGAITNPMADSLSRQTLTNQGGIRTPPKAEPFRPKEPEVIVPYKPKICDINLKLIASPQKGMQIYYVTGLVPGEFKCWVDMENASIKLCNGTPCLLYFVDTPNPKVTSTPPHFLDAATLSKYGVGRFDYNGKNWEMKGANMWGRKDKGYGYYNTDNAGGG
ncbi:MAG TPA: hypothetical protein VFG10_19870 [Saprospiraceae bacterium]|nr:hypothetical protein [Saprospiraceae bacterium]